MAADYARLVDGTDITDDADLVARILSRDLRVYLDLYFRGWRLLTRVEEHQSRSPKRRQSWKDVAYVVAVATERDAEIVAKKLQTIRYKMPCSWLKISDILFKLPEEGKLWIKRMNGDLSSVETVLNNVGEESFLENWLTHKKDWDFFQHF